MTRQWLTFPIFVVCACSSASMPTQAPERPYQDLPPSEVVAVVYDRRSLDLTLTVHSEGPQTFISIDARGLPNRHGRISLSLLRHTPDGDDLVHTENRSYTPSASIARFAVDLPPGLSYGDYKLEVSLVLYDAAGEELPSETRTLMLHIETDRTPAAPAVEGEDVALELTAYALNQTLPAPEHIHQLDKFLRSLQDREVESITISAHTCDLGTPGTNELKAQQRARAVAQIVSEQFPALSLTILHVPHQQSTIGAPGDRENERAGFRRVVVSATVRSGTSP